MVGDGQHHLEKPDDFKQPRICRTKEPGHSKTSRAGDRKRLIRKAGGEISAVEEVMR